MKNFGAVAQSSGKARKRGSRNSLLLSGALAAMAIAAPPSAFAQEAATPADEAADNTADIIVTAQKRSERLQDVPITITSIGQSELRDAGVRQMFDLPRLVPTLRLGDSPGTVGARINIRGVGSFGNSALEPSVAVFLDNVYVPRPSSIVGNMFDVGSVEVLSGPQGTLFGRNASAGAITIRSAEPEEQFSGEVQAQASTLDRYRFEGHVNTPLSDTVAFRLAGLADLRGGDWINDLTGKRAGGVDTYAARASLKIDLSSNLSWLVRGDYTKADGMPWRNWQLDPETVSPAALARFTAVQGTAPKLDQYSTHNSVYTEEMSTDSDHWGVASDLSLDLDQGFTIRLVQGYRDWRADESDGDNLSLSIPIFGRDIHWRSKSHSHDLQFISNQGAILDGKLDFVGGLYYFEEDLLIDYRNNFLENFCPVIIGRVAPALLGACASGVQRSVTQVGLDQNTKSLAAYGQATIKVIPKVDLSLGARWTRDRKDGDFYSFVNNPAATILASNEQTELHLDDDRMTWRANLMWRPTDDLRLFATYSTGFKSGGFNNGASLVPLGQARIFAPETVKNYEIGVKSQWLDRRVTINATAYRMDVANFQERAFDPDLNVSIIRNVGNFRNQGVDLTVNARPTKNAGLNFSLSYLDSEFKSYPGAPNPPYIPGVQDLRGAPLSYAPKWSGSVGGELGGQFGASGFSWLFRSDLSFVSSQYIGATIDNGPLTRQDGYSLLSARLTITSPDDRFSVGIFGTNLTDKGYCQDKAYQVLDGPLGVRTPGVGTPVRCIVGAPREIGITAGAKF